MSKAEKFIEDNTNQFSNEDGFDYIPWLTAEQARKAVEIARDETTDKIKQLLKEKYLIKSIEPLRWVSWEKVFNDLKQAMEDEEVR